MATETIKGLSVIANPTASSKPFYCTETQWREQSGFTDTNEYTSAEVSRWLKNATEKIRKDAFHMVRFELVTKDSSDRYFVQRRYFGNRYGRDDDAMKIVCGDVSKYDIEVYEADTTSSVAASLALQGTRLNRLMYKIPYDGVTEIDPLNGFFKLSDDYPTDSTRQIYVTYWVSGKPLDELDYELKQACIEMTTILALKKNRDKWLRRGATSISHGKKTVTRDVQAFKDLLKEHEDKYHSWIRWCKPFIGRKVKIGRLETANSRRFINRY